MRKCPYQTITKEEVGVSIKYITHTFADCLYSDCPWWKTETNINCCLSIPGHCTRVTKENPKK